MAKQPINKSFQYAFEGILTCIKKERNIKIHLVMMVLVIICGFIFSLTKIEWMICILLFALVISLEILNTAIEAIVDLCSPSYHPLAKIAKDCGAGAVLVSAIAAAIIGLMIFIPHLLAVL
ncbi:MAG: diacylglycerol kinase family protein [Erysipelotrichaceae bacterium]|nr:diacylglycerol kinase family protein [Erysipelotrichaceae bacterium]